MRPKFLRWAAGLVVAATLVSCDSDSPTFNGQPSRRTLATFSCTAEVATGAVRCSELPESEGPNRVILGQNQVKLTSINVAYDTTTRIFSADIDVKNLLTVAIGTADGWYDDGGAHRHERGGCGGLRPARAGSDA